MNILLTGGAGYIGSHTAVALYHAGYTPVLLDNFANSHPGVLGRLHQITGRPVALEHGDILSTPWLEQVLRRVRPAGVLHFAGDKAVGESVAQPLRYFHHNVGGAISLLQALQRVYGGLDAAPPLVFSSSATVYGDPGRVPYVEDMPFGPTSPYGTTKQVVEQLLAAQGVASPAWPVAVLRYFNPVGAHPSGLIGEDPAGTPNNLMPFVTQVAVGQRPELAIFGHDYPTPDGTGVRDYIHVMDLAEGHVAALRALLAGDGSFTVNLGTGRGCSVLELVHAFQRASGRTVPYRFAPRRPGDIARCWADPSRANKRLGWQARRTLDDMCADSWRWQQANPTGYR